MIAVDQFRREFLFKKRGHCKQVRFPEGCKRISAKYHNISKVASIFGITRVTMRRWIKDFDRESIGGLVVRKGRGRKKIFTKDYENKVYKIIKKNPNITAKQHHLICQPFSGH